MDYRIKKKDHHKHYHKNDLDISQIFAKEAMKECGNLIKSIVLFGSHAKNIKINSHKSEKKSDIDVLIIINDVNIILTKELSETYKIIMEKIILKVSKKIHLTTLTLSNFWDLVRNGDPLIINILRDGVPMIDTGFFDPMQALLYQGKVRPTWESIWKYYQRAPSSLHNSRWHILQATLDLYWAVIDSAHAALMRVGEIPPSPSHVADLLEKALYKKGLIQKHHVTVMSNFHHLAKHIMKRELRDISGKDYEKYYRQANEFVDVMKKIIDQGVN